MVKSIDWLILPEKESQALKVCAGVFDRLNFTGSLNAQAKRAFTHGGFSQTDKSSLLKGTVVVARFQGHLYEMAWPDEQDEKYAWKIPEQTDRFGAVISGGYKSSAEVLHDYPITLDQANIKWKSNGGHTVRLANNLAKLITQAKNVIVSTDYDAEGEMIFRNWLYVKRHDQIDWAHTYRVKLGGLDVTSVRRAFTQKNLQNYVTDSKQVDKLAAAGMARAIADYEYGLSFSYYGRQFERELSNHQKALGGYGRLKNVIMGTVFQTEQAYDDWRQSSNYRIDLQLPDGTTLKGVTNGGIVTDKLGLGTTGLSFKTESAAQTWLNRLLLPQQVTVKRTSKLSTSKSPALFNRSQLIVAAGQHDINLLSKGQTWDNVLQSLYEKREVFSYIRTDCKYIFKTDYIDMQTVITYPFIQKLLNQEIRAVAKRHQLKSDIKFDSHKAPDPRWVNDKEAGKESHGAIIATLKDPQAIWQDFSPVEQAVYQRDLRQTMAMFANDCVTESFSYQTIGNVQGLFTDKRSQIKTYGWRLLLGQIPKQETISDAYTGVAKYVVTEVKAKRPSLMTDGQLLNYLEHHQWGTAATRDQTITALQKKRAMVVKKGKLRVNPELKTTIAYLLDHGLIDYQLTGQWQKALSQLENQQAAQRFIEINRKLNRQLNAKVTKLLVGGG